jgi:hypothetical protein
MRESKQSEIELKGTSIDAFKGLLKYIYTGHMSLASLKVIPLMVNYLMAFYSKLKQMYGRLIKTMIYIL